MAVITMVGAALVFLVAMVAVFSIVGFAPIVLLGPEEAGPELLLSPVVGLAALYLACQWLSPFLASSTIVVGTLAIGAVTSALAMLLAGPALRSAVVTAVRMFIVPGAISVVTYLSLLIHLFKLRLFTLAGTGFDAIFVYAPAAEFMRRHAYTTSARPALDVPALPTLVANFYPGSLGTVDGGLGAIIRRPAFAIIEPLNAVCVVLALVGVYVLVTAGLSCSRRTAALAVLLVAADQFLFWSAGFDFVQQLRALALLPGALALLILSLRTERARLGILAGGVGAACVAIYMPVFLVLLSAAAGAVIAYVVKNAVSRAWVRPSRVVLAVAGGGLVFGLPSVRWLLFDGGLRTWDLVSRNLFSPYPAGGILDRFYDLPYLTGAAPVAYLYHIKPLLFWGPPWSGLTHIFAYATVALALLGFAGLVRDQRWPEAALFAGGFAYLGFVFASGNPYGLVKTVAYLVPLSSCLVAMGAARLAHIGPTVGRRAIGRVPAVMAAVVVSLVLAAKVASATETWHLFLQLPPTISRQQAALRALPSRMTGPGAVLIQDFSAPIPSTPLTVNSVLDHIIANFITNRDVTIAWPALKPELTGRFRFLVQTGTGPDPSAEYVLLWRDAGLGVSLYGRA